MVRLISPTIVARDKSDVSRAMSDMETKGIVIRLSGGKNTYRAKLVLTEQGRRAAEHIEQRAMLAVESGGRGLGDARREALYESLELIVENLRSVCEQGLGSDE